jgi:hypothetical protein
MLNGFTSAVDLRPGELMLFDRGQMPGTDSPHWVPVPERARRVLARALERVPSLPTHTYRGLRDASCAYGSAKLN